MYQDSWGLYEARLPRKRIFHPRKRSILAPLLTIMAALVVIYEAVRLF